jgi:hypothetical protein
MQINIARAEWAETFSNKEDEWHAHASVNVATTVAGVQQEQQ